MGPLRQDIRSQSRLLIEPPHLVLYEFHPAEKLSKSSPSLSDPLCAFIGLDRQPPKMLNLLLTPCLPGDAT
jgi:hypothetical protein